MHMNGKSLVRPAGGVEAWLVHGGLLEAQHGAFFTDQRCAILLHARNFLFDRTGYSLFVREAVDWQWMRKAVPGPKGVPYAKHCLSAAEDVFNLTYTIW